MSLVVLRRAPLVVVALLCPTVAAAQGPTTTLRIDGPGSQWVAGVLRCRVGESAQFSIQGLDADGNRSILEKSRPVARSSDPRVVSAIVPDYSPYILNLVCRGDGQARVQVTAGDVTASFAAMVGTARDAEPAHVASAASGPVAVVGTAAPMLVNPEVVRMPAADVRLTTGPLVAQGVAWPPTDIRLTTSAILAQGPVWPPAEVRLTTAVLQATGRSITRTTTAPRTVLHQEK